MGDPDGARPCIRQNHGVGEDDACMRSRFACNYFNTMTESMQAEVACRQTIGGAQSSGMDISPSTALYGSIRGVLSIEGVHRHAMPRLDKECVCACGDPHHGSAPT